MRGSGDGRPGSWERRRGELELLLTWEVAVSKVRTHELGSCLAR